MVDDAMMGRWGVATETVVGRGGGWLVGVISSELVEGGGRGEWGEEGVEGVSVSVESSSTCEFADPIPVEAERKNIEHLFRTQYPGGFNTFLGQLIFFEMTVLGFWLQFALSF